MKQMIVIILATMSVAANSSAGDSYPEYGVYEYVVQKSTLDFEAACAALENTTDADFQVLGSTEVPGPKDCGYRSRVILLFDSAYSARLLEANRQTGPYAAVDRVNVFEAEDGVHVSIVNPLSINRTILMDDTLFVAMSEKHRRELRELIAEMVPGESSEKQYGQARDKGYIGRTFGIMAGGKFIDKLDEIVKLTDADFSDVVSKLKVGLAESAGKWDMQLVYSVALPEADIHVFGSNGTPMATKSFDIVKAGSDKDRKKLACPGLAHAGGYPIEIVVSRDDEGAVTVRLCEIMFRMKMYFEDAGTWAFAKNMGMPLSIQDELVKQVEAALD